VLFLRLGARALVISGANRCAAKAESPCSGKTRVCRDGNNPYRASDPAHNPATLFHVAHRSFSQRWPKSIVFQPHGFENSGRSVWFVISDGSTEKRPGDTMLTGRVRDAIRQAIGRERAVSCQDPDDKSMQTRWLCASTTVQGRDLNGSPDACHSNAERASGRFLHIEQSYEEVRRGYGLDWANLAAYPGSAAILAAATPALADIEKMEAEGDVMTVMNRLETNIATAGSTVFAKVDHCGGAESVNMPRDDSQPIIIGKRA